MASPGAELHESAPESGRHKADRGIPALAGSEMLTQASHILGRTVL